MPYWDWQMWLITAVFGVIGATPITKYLIDDWRDRRHKR